MKEERNCDYTQLFPLSLINCVGDTEIIVMTNTVGAFENSLEED